MKVINTSGLHPVLYTALSSSYIRNQENRNQERKDWSVTELLLPPKIAILTKRHSDELEIDAINLLDVSFGTILHSLIETSYKHLNLPNIFLETKVKTVFQDKIISGRVDYYDLDKKEIIDFKYYKAWSWIFIKHKIDELSWQLNLYGWLMQLNGYPVEKLSVLFIFKDFNKTTKAKTANYPDNVWQELHIPFMPKADIETYLQERLEILDKYEQMPDVEIPNCDYLDRWQKQDSYSLYYQGKKLHDFLSEEDAEMFAENNGLENTEIIHHRYPAKRCESYCGVNQFCIFYNKSL